jgi:hypothetical protein
MDQDSGKDAHRTLSAKLANEVEHLRGVGNYHDAIPCRPQPFQHAPQHCHLSCTHITTLRNAQICLTLATRCG